MNTPTRTLFLKPVYSWLARKNLKKALRLKRDLRLDMEEMARAVSSSRRSIRSAERKAKLYEILAA